MISIGLTEWGDHYSLYEDLERQTNKLRMYVSHSPVVELDVSYYTVQPERSILKWINETPNKFQFIVKIYQALTFHSNYKTYVDSRSELLKQFRHMPEPLIAHHKLAMVLVQFPPWFGCTVQNISYTLYVRQQLEDIPMCVEFRHQSWFNSQFKEQTLMFLTEHQIIHMVIDEPQIRDGSIPLVNRITSSTAFVRYHGRSQHGWTKKDITDQEWRDVRYLYNYNEDELKDLANKAQILEQKAKKVYIIFDNNSGSYATQNARTYRDILDIECIDLAP